VRSFKTTVHLRFSHFELDPDELTAAFQVKPANLHRKGDPKQSAPHPGVPPWTHHYWSAARQVASEDLPTEGVEFWLAILEANRGTVERALGGVGKGNLWLTFQAKVTAAESFDDGVSFAPSLLHRIAHLGLELQVESFVGFATDGTGEYGHQM